MEKNIDANVESMIQMFMKYGTKDSLSVDEFLMFRKQAVRERLKGIKGSGDDRADVSASVCSENGIAMPAAIQTDIPYKKEADCLHESRTSGIFQNTAAQTRQDADYNAPHYDDSDEDDMENEEFTDADFLNMMRCIED